MGSSVVTNIHTSVLVLVWFGLVLVVHGRLLMNVGIGEGFSLCCFGMQSYAVKAGLNFLCDLV